MRLAAVVPAAPALLTELTGGPVAELEPVRRATASAIGRLASALEGGAGPLVVLAPGSTTRRLRADAVTGLDGFGVSLPPVEAARSGSVDRRRPEFRDDQGILTASSMAPPVGAALGLRLLGVAGIDLGESPDGVVVYEVSLREPVSGCLRLGASLAAECGPAAVWLVLGDGSGRRTPKAPGAFDPDAEPFDDAAAKALASVDPAALAALDAERGIRLMAAGRAPWQVLAGAASAAMGLLDAPARGVVTYHDAPLGVGYLVATWDLGPPGALDPPGPPGDA